MLAFTRCAMLLVVLSIALIACGAPATPTTAPATATVLTATPTRASATPTVVPRQPDALDTPHPSPTVSAVTPTPPMTPAQPSATPSIVGQKIAVSGGAFTRVSPDELKTMSARKDFLLVNTHIPYEGEIEQTDAFIPFDTIAQNLNQLPADRNAKIFLYCRSGRMSTEAAETLAKLGYTNVWELGGGMMEWERRGFLLIKK